LNGYSALAELDKDRIYRIAKTLLPNIEVRLTTSIYKKIPLIDGVQGHYKVLSLNDFEVLKNA
jgi:hypothetical protein